jgi:hypothetical protein
MTRPSRWYKYESATRGRVKVDVRWIGDFDECFAYWRRLVAYYIQEAREAARDYRKAIRLWWDESARADIRILKCANTIRRLRAERDQLLWDLSAAREALREQLVAQREVAEKAKAELDAARAAELVALSSGDDCNRCEAKAEAWHEALDELAMIENVREVAALRSRYPRPEKGARREKPAMACETCSKWERNSPSGSHGMCLDEGVQAAMWGADVECYTPRKDFCCNRHVEKEGTGG